MVCKYTIAATCVNYVQIAIGRGNLPLGEPIIMAARTDGEMVSVPGQFHPKCGDQVKLSEDRRVASGPPAGSLWPQIAVSNAPIPRGLNFSVKVLQEGEDVYVSPPTRKPCILQCTTCLGYVHAIAINLRLVSCRCWV